VRRAELTRYLEVYMIEERTTAAVFGGMASAWATGPNLQGVHYYNLGTYSQQRLLDYMWISE